MNIAIEKLINITLDPLLMLSGLVFVGGLAILGLELVAWMRFNRGMEDEI